MLTLGYWFLWGSGLVMAAMFVLVLIAIRIIASLAFDHYQVPSRELASAGLALDIIGVGLIWRYGLPESVNRSGQISLVLPETDRVGPLKAKFYDFFSISGLVALIVGFGLQIASNWFGAP